MITSYINSYTIEFIFSYSYMNWYFEFMNLPSHSMYKFICLDLWIYVWIWGYQGSRWWALSLVSLGQCKVLVHLQDQGPYVALGSPGLGWHHDREGSESTAQGTLPLHTKFAVTVLSCSTHCNWKIWNIMIPRTSLVQKSLQVTVHCLHWVAGSSSLSIASSNNCWQLAWPGPFLESESTWAAAAAGCCTQAAKHTEQRLAQKPKYY